MTDRPGSFPRCGESGGVAVMVAVSFTMLLGLSALAVDFGYLYQTRQKMQTAADAAVMAGLPDMSSSTTTAHDSALAIATACGFSGAVVDSTSVSNQLTVTITSTNQMFFGRLFGLSSRSLTATAIGTTLAVPALFAGNTACTIPGSTSPISIQMGAAGYLNVNGAIQTNGGVDINNPGLGGGGTQTYATGCPCTLCPNPSPGGTANAFPFSYTTASFTCGNGTTMSTPGPVTVSGPVSGVWCSAGDINVNAGGALTGTATFVAGGHITFSAPSANLTAAQNGVIAFSTSNSGCVGIPAINMGSGDLTENGSFLAPNGCVSANANTLQVTGSIAGAEVGIQINGGGVGGSSITPGAGSGGYTLYR